MDWSLRLRKQIHGNPLTRSNDARLLLRTILLFWGAQSVLIHQVGHYLEPKHILSEVKSRAYAAISEAIYIVVGSLFPQAERGAPIKVKSR